MRTLPGSLARSWYWPSHRTRAARAGPRGLLPRPGWDHYQNRIVGTELPEVIQDFGWRRTDRTGGGPGESAGGSRTRGGRPTTPCRWASP